jgi:Secretion system C-terminal sorting domain
MKKLQRCLPLAIAFVCAITAGAQPTLTSSNYAPVIGLAREYGTVPLADPGPSGADAVWDFSGLSSVSEEVVEYYDHSQDEYASDFPTATHGGYFVHDGMNYYHTASTGIEMLGFKYYFSPFAQDFFDLATDPLVYLPFPCTYGTTWSDAGAGTYRTFKTAGVRTYVASINGEATGYGTLVLPNATYENVLRVDWVRYQNVNNLEVGYEWTMSSFYMAGYPLPLAEWEHMKIWLNGDLFEDPAEGTMRWVLDPVMNVSDATQAVEFEVHPNPATDQVVVQLGAWGAGTEVTLSDAAGRIVRSMAVTTDRVVVDIGSLHSGAYFITVVGPSGSRTQRLLVN